MDQVLPLQRLSREDKTSNDYKWFKDVINFYIHNSSFTGLNVVRVGDSKEPSKSDQVSMLYGLYNNDIPAEWFKHMTEPINGEADFMPAKIRPLNILKPTADFLISSFGKRPLQYTVTNQEQSAYNDFLEKKKQYADSVIQQRYVQTLKTGEQQDGTPEKLIDEFSLSYKDALSSKGQSLLDDIISKSDVIEKFNELFLKYVVTGEPISYRTIENGKVIYRVVDENNFTKGVTSQSNYGEDAPWCVERRSLTVNEFADEFYDKINEKDWNKIDDTAKFSPMQIANYFSNRGSTADRYIDVYHVCWNGLKRQGSIYITDEFGQVKEEKVDEAYVPAKGEKVEWGWVSQVYHGYRAGTDFFTSLGEYPYAISNANGLPNTKLPYNSINFGYRTNKIFSPLKMGIPYLIYYLICNYAIEKLLAKNKGKLLLLDTNVIPKTEGWDEKKFMKYLEGMGYMFINRNQIGVDKSFNQYTSVDMSTLGDVKQLIDLAEHYKGQWDDVIGIPRQMRGQTYASDQVGTTQAAIVQSGVTIDYIFQKFERFMNREFQYLMELGKYLTLDGYKSLIDKDEYGTELLNIEPGELLINLGVKVLSSGKEIDDLNEVKQYAKTVNQQDPLTVVSILTARNLSQLKKVLNKIQRNQEKNQQAGAEQEHNNAMEIESLKKDLLEFQKTLDKEYMHEEYAEKQELEFIKGEVSLATAKNVNPEMIVDSNNDNLRDIDDIIESSRNRQSNENIKNKELAYKYTELQTKERMADKKNKTDLQNKVVGERNKSKSK